MYFWFNNPKIIKFDEDPLKRFFIKLWQLMLSFLELRHYLKSAPREKKTHKISKAEVRRRKKESIAYDAKSWQDLKKKKDKSIEKNKGSVVKCGHLHWKIYEGIKTLRLQKLGIKTILACVASPRLICVTVHNSQDQKNCLLEIIVNLCGF